MGTELWSEREPLDRLQILWRAFNAELLKRLESDLGQDVQVVRVPHSILEMQRLVERRSAPVGISKKVVCGDVGIEVREMVPVIDLKAHHPVVMQKPMALGQDGPD